jgi:glycosyltransferase involved in cell wall biosynthesis
MERKVLIITYYWPPSGGSGVQRWLKFVKYLPEFGWVPFVFTPENPSFAVRDESLLGDVPPSAEVLKLPIWEPYDLFIWLSRLSGNGNRDVKPTALMSGKKDSFFQSLSTWLRGNLFIPDPRRFWVRPSVRFLEGLIRDNAINTIVTTGPPHSIHLIGYDLKKKFPGVRWLADFRDPWSRWGFLESLRVGRIARRIHERLEAKVLKAADELITITPFYRDQFSRLSHRRVHLITNGFDEDDVSGIPFRASPDYIIRHVGIINERCDPRPFMRVLRKLLEVNELFRKSVRMEFIGEVHPAFQSEVEQDPVLNRSTAFVGSVPHNELMTRYGDAALLLIVLHGYKDAEGYMPGKLFEYLATGLAILGIGPSLGDTASLLKETGAGGMVEATDAPAIENFLLAEFEKWNGVPVRKPLREATMKYSRRELTRTLVELL